jgi:iron complex transport system permease protein
MSRRSLFAAVVAIILLIAAVAIAFAIGRFPIAPGDLMALVWAKLTGGTHSLPPTAETVLFQIRGPRVLAALTVGAALAAAGAAYQNLFRNPLVSPDILGVSSGAALGAALGIFLSLDLWWIQGFAFAFGLGVVAAVYLIGQAVKGHDPILVLILAGVVIGALLGSVLALLKYLADPYNQLPAITFWLLG